MYKVIKAFSDVSDKGFMYRVGDSYPRPGYEPDKARINELASSSNRLGCPLIEYGYLSTVLEDEQTAPKKRGRKKAED